MSETLFLILSGTYVAPELVSEFGQLPPCFLPNGTQRLYEQQIAFAQALSPVIVMLLPESFQVPYFDSEKLSAWGVRVIRTGANKTISESLAEALRTLQHTGRLFLLFGDTLVTYGEGASEPDTFASGSTRHLAKWADYYEVDGQIHFREYVQIADKKRDVVAGFFDFADAGLLRAQAEKYTDFITVLNTYAASRRFTPTPSARWLDFGHLHTYYWSRRTELTARSFNEVIGDGLMLRKTGTPARKIFAEALWFQNLPTRLRPFVPHFIELHKEPKVGYELEYLHLPILAELYCFARLPSQLWFRILSSCKDFLETCQTIVPAEFETTAIYPGHFFKDMLVGKTFNRLKMFAAETGFSLDEPWTFNSQPIPSLTQIAQKMINLVNPSTAEDICLWHGDFHFGNIFFDFRSQRVRVVDPRGMLSDGTLTMYGDARYDISKLTHSVVGMYDHILAERCILNYDGRYNISLDFMLDQERELLIKEYLNLRIGRYACGDAQMIALVALLFLSMLPLHSNDRNRQLALLANGLRLALLAETLV